MPYTSSEDPDQTSRPSHPPQPHPLIPSFPTAPQPSSAPLSPPQPSLVLPRPSYNWTTRSRVQHADISSPHFLFLLPHLLNRFEVLLDAHRSAKNRRDVKLQRLSSNVEVVARSWKRKYHHYLHQHHRRRRHHHNHLDLNDGSLPFHRRTNG